MHPALAGVLAAVLVTCAATDGRAAIASAAPAPHAPAAQAPAAQASAPADGTGRAFRVHRAIVSCEYAPFYVWPERNSAPFPSTYPSARLGDGFDVIGDGTLTYGTLTLYETTIDVVHPFGSGVHYWISARCVNAG